MLNNKNEAGNLLPTDANSVQVANATNVINLCPISPEIVKFMQQLYEMRQYFENHRYHKECKVGSVEHDSLSSLAEHLDGAAWDMSYLASYELRESLYSCGTDLTKERRVQ